MSLDLATDLRDALVDDATIGPLLPQYLGEPAVATRRPVPADFPALCIIVNPDSGITDQDFLNTQMPIVVRNIAVYGNQPDDYRTVEQLAYAVRELFHRQKWAIRPNGYQVLDIVASGPLPAPNDDETTVGRIVGLTISLRRA